MKAQFRIMACVVAALASGAAVAGVNTNPGTAAGTQGTGGQVEFTGEITDTSCNIDSASASQTVDLGAWAKSYFTSTVTETTKTPFHIKVKDCPSSVKKVAVLFDGKKDSNNPDLLAVNGGAAGVGIKLYNDDKSTKIPVGTLSDSKTVKAGSGADALGSADLTFYADYMADGDTIATGQANGTADFNMVYN